MIKEISDKFCKEFPISEGLVDWDNIGILINSSTTTNKVLLTIDLTDEVIEECISNKIQNVIAYHPVIFKGIKNVNETDIVYKCIRNGISVYCPHTSLDKRMNEYLLKCIQKEMNVSSDCFYESLVCIGKINKSTNEILGCVKKLLNLKHVRIAYPKNKEFIPEKVLVGVGAGFTYVNHSNSLIITGEMRHHEILHSVKKGNFVILVEHSNGERFFLNELEKICKNILPNFLFYVSKNDKDPIEIE